MKSCRRSSTAHLAAAADYSKGSSELTTPLKADARPTHAVVGPFTAFRVSAKDYAHRTTNRPWLGLEVFRLSKSWEAGQFIALRPRVARIALFSLPGHGRGAAGARRAGALYKVKATPRWSVVGHVKT